MRLALLFPGQGVQHAAMLPWLADEPAAAPVLAGMAARLGADWRARLADTTWASSNAVAQCLMTGTGLAAWQGLRDRLPVPVAFAGYSVGELAAYSAAGVFDADQALAIAVLRSRAMDAAAAQAPGGLISVIGSTPAAVEAICRDAGVEVAIRIAPDRLVLGGPTQALDAAEAALREGPAATLRLPVRIASHTGAMQAAAQDIARSLAPMAWKQPVGALIVGRDGSVLRGVEALKQALAGQTDHTVQWQAAMQTLAERRPDCVLEVGAGTSLSAMWRAAQPGIRVRSVDEFRSADAVVRWVHGA